jgi:hypothetical protein
MSPFAPTLQVTPMGFTIKAAEPETLQHANVFISANNIPHHINAPSPCILHSDFLCGRYEIVLPNFWVA